MVLILSENLTRYIHFILEKFVVIWTTNFAQHFNHAIFSANLIYNLLAHSRNKYFLVG